MRKMNILEIDSHCYVVTTEDFKNDDIEYNWASTPGHFYAENQRTRKRFYFPWEDYQEFGQAIDRIWSIESHSAAGTSVHTGVRGLD